MNNSLLSKIYLENIKIYKTIHKNGYHKINGEFVNKEKAFNGISTVPYANIIKNIIKKNKLNSLLDYGCGKAEFYDKKSIFNNEVLPPLREFWNIDISLFDPCYDKYSTLPKVNGNDITICIDVLEHIPAEDISIILEKISSYTRKYIFINVACYEAVALLPNGKNAHINIQEPKWWFEKLKNLADIRENLKIICNCTLKNNGKVSHFPLQFNDKLEKYL